MATPGNETTAILDFVFTPSFRIDDNERSRTLRKRNDDAANPKNDPRTKLEVDLDKSHEELFLGEDGGERVVIISIIYGDNECVNDLRLFVDSNQFHSQSTHNRRTTLLVIIMLCLTGDEARFLKKENF